ncbi:protein NUCLEAR FUSION DEFECTIVE 4-like [Silene latifolia]|uniref:protein NUCLEAR FUSION DEFECTIVE 4-like n=1 Tax=Silene latifolia TaxID=37657 RepID=UPI003D7880D4
MTLAIKAGTRPPWVGLAAAVWVQLGSGNPYTFPLYSPTLKSVLGLSQQKITLLGVAVDIGESAGILPGMACNKFPPWVVLFIGALSCFCGYGVIWLAATETLKNLPYWLLWIAHLAAANSSAWFSTTVIVTNMKNFPLNRGTVAGLMKGYSALAAGIFTEIYSMVLNKSTSALLLFLTFGLPVICFVMMTLVKLCSPATSSEDTSQNFLFVQCAGVVLGIFLLTTQVLDSTITLARSVCYSFIVIMVVLMLAPLAIPVKMTLFPSEKKVESSMTDSDPLLPTKSALETQSGQNILSSSESDQNLLLAVGEGAVENKKRRPRRGEDFTFREAMVKADFWLLWLVYFLGSGSGVTVVNNLSQIGYSQGNGNDTTMLLSLFSFCFFVGRLGGGAVPEYFVSTKAIPRTIWMSFSQVVMLVSFLLYASNLNGTHYIATGLIGICYGVQFTTMIPVASELFGLKSFGVIFNFMMLGNPVGAFLFSSLLAGSVYDAEAARQGVSACYGAECFRFTFLVLAAACGIGAALGVVLTVRIRPVYQMLYSSGSFSIH